MKIIYARQPHQIDYNSVFLAGPSPRDPNVKSWRPEAIKIFSDLGFDGTLFVPEDETWHPLEDYTAQVEWERFGLNSASCIMFWIPREFPEMPALTTNVEFGWYLAIRSNRIVYGRPQNAEKCKYLDWLYKKVTKHEPTVSLEETIKEAIRNAAEFSSRPLPEFFSVCYSAMKTFFKT